MRSVLLLVFLIILSTNRIIAQCDACESLQDKIINGDFENGNSAFTSSLEYVTFFPFICTLCPENTYAIGNNATLFHNGFTGTDHTNPPSGDFFIANAPGEEGVAVWCQTTTVLPQTTYTLTFWARDIANNSNPHPLAVLKPSFNGEIFPDSLIADGGWSSLTVNWFSDENTTLDICILDFQSQTGGNDFGLDDISLTACEPIVLSQPVFAGNDTTVCSRDEIMLGINPLAGYTYSWNSTQYLSSDQIGNPVFNFDNLTGLPVEFDYWVTRDSAGVGCIASDTIHLEVLPMAVFELGSDLMICPGDSVSLFAGDNWDSIIWSTGDSTSVIQVTEGNYTASVFTGVCAETDSLSVSTIDVPSANLPSNIDHCNVDTLFVNAAVDGSWVFENLTYNNPIQINSSGVYYYYYDYEDCAITDTVSIELYTMHEAELISDTTLCEGTTATIFSQWEGLWNDGSFGISLNISQPGEYSIEVNNGPCVNRDTLLVNGLEQPIIALGADTTFCEDYPIMLDAENNDATYLWSTGDTTATIITSGSGIYSVEVTNRCGTTSDEISITNFMCSWQLYIPTCFTPNDDSFNEGWKVEGYNLRAVDIVVYNRFGDAIFHTDDIQEAWTPGSQIGDDTYNFRIEVTPFMGEKVVRTGAIYLIR